MGLSVIIIAVAFPIRRFDKLSAKLCKNSSGQPSFSSFWYPLQILPPAWDSLGNCNCLRSIVWEAKRGAKCNSLQYFCSCCVDDAVALDGHTTLVQKIPSKEEHSQCGTLGHGSHYLSRVFLRWYLEITTTLISSVSAIRQPLAFQYIFSSDISEALFRVSPTPKWTVVSYTPERCGNKQPCQLKWRLTSCISNEYWPEEKGIGREKKIKNEKNGWLRSASMHRVWNSIIKRVWPGVGIMPEPLSAKPKMFEEIALKTWMLWG